MRLKKIKLAGFKSFVDPTTINLPSNLIGIVGPNGCGKSNTIDAVRWVMGESSAKHLRGESMADVIFNGSSSRKPVGHAAIELVFDNSDGRLGGEYAAYSEISVKRQVSRDGQSRYYLNGVHCRRRDITDIFLGTGLGPRSYAIIEQGMISRLIEAKPDELRVFLEEAAGISKYKERRRETETRMRHAQENLSRLNDIRSEIEKQLQTLQRQAKVAEKYQELKQQERLFKAQLLALRWRVLDAGTHEQQRQIAAQETALEAALAELRKIEAVIEQQREQHIEENEAFNQVQGHYYSTGAEIARLEQALHHARETRQQQQHDLARVEQAWNESQTHLVNDDQSITDLAQSLRGDEAALTRTQEVEALSSAALAVAEAAQHTWQQAWDEFNTQASAQLRAAEVERARIQQLEQHLRQIEQRLARLEDEQRGLSTGTLEEEIAALSEQRMMLDEQVANYEHEVQDHQARIAAERDNHNRLASDLNAQRGRLQAMKGRHASLEVLQQQALGKSGAGAAVTSWLKQHQLDGAQRLAQGLKVETGWEHAVEHVLGFNLEAVCVQGMENIANLLGTLQHGKLAVFDLAAPHREVLVLREAGCREQPPAPASSMSGLNPLLSKIQSPWSLDALLSGVCIADDVAHALTLRAQLAPHQSVITREGVWLGTNWLRVVGDADEKAGVLSREQEIKELLRQMDDLSETIDELEINQKDNQENLKSLEILREQSQKALNEAAHRRGEVRAQASGKQARREQMLSRSSRLHHEIDDVRQQKISDEQEIAEARLRLEDALGATEGHALHRDDLTRQRDEHRNALDQVRMQARGDRDAAHQVALRIQTVRTQLAATQQRMTRAQEQIGHLTQRREELTAALAASEQPLRDMAAELEQMLGRRLAVEAELAQARRRVEECDHILRQASNEHQATEQKVRRLRDELDQLRMHWQEVKVRRETLQEQLAADKHKGGFVLDELLAAMPAEASEGEWQAQVERITQQIQRLGAINLAAIDEFAAQSERKAYLDAQNADLMEALTTLENAIRKIDRETRDTFKDTFDKVNTGLQAMFPRLFGGGQAYLELTGDDLLDTGVTVMARPPGKRNSTIHLLSGGEKALTAVALVFAIFELNPAPFCMLDEVDAPLDEANVGRFCKLVKEMSERIQFVYITHNKATMEMAEHLMGVTMHEPGVSRLVTVDVEEAVKLVAAG